jgi:hypothetical protein
MKMVGHKTEAIYRRYAIADESMLREGAAKLEALLQAQRGAVHVVALRTGKVSAKSPGFDMPMEGVSIAELTERITREMAGRDGIEPPTPGFSDLVVDRVDRLNFRLLALCLTLASSSGESRRIARRRAA